MSLISSMMPRTPSDGCEVYTLKKPIKSLTNWRQIGRNIMKKVTILFKDHFKTAFMQNADVFESFKVLVTSTVATVVDDFGESHVQAILEKTNEDTNYGVVAIFDKEKVYYRDPEVKVVSNGHVWNLLDDMLPKNVQS
jgi:hypothetical protein